MSGASPISDRFRELTRKNSGFKHTPAVGLDASAMTKILQLPSVEVFIFVPYKYYGVDNKSYVSQI